MMDTRPQTTRKDKTVASPTTPHTTPGATARVLLVLPASKTTWGLYTPSSDGTIGPRVRTCSSKAEAVRHAETCAPAVYAVPAGHRPNSGALFDRYLDLYCTTCGRIGRQTAIAWAVERLCGHLCATA
jgi:hypothetical protein